MAVVTEITSLKRRFTAAEIEAMRRPQREALRFLIEGEDGKAKWNIYRITPEDGIAYCNHVCENQIYKTYTGVLTLRVLSRVSNTEWKEIGYIQREKEGYFEETLLGDLNI